MRFSRSTVFWRSVACSPWLGAAVPTREGEYMSVMLTYLEAIVTGGKCLCALWAVGCAAAGLTQARYRALSGWRGAAAACCLRGIVPEAGRDNISEEITEGSARSLCRPRRLYLYRRKARAFPGGQFAR